MQFSSAKLLIVFAFRSNVMSSRPNNSRSEAYLSTVSYLLMILLASSMRGKFEMAMIDLNSMLTSVSIKLFSHFSIVGSMVTFINISRGECLFYKSSGVPFQVFVSETTSLAAHLVKIAHVVRYPFSKS